MKKISEADIKILKSQGVKIRHENGSIVIPKEPLPQVTKKEQPDRLAQALEKAVDQASEVVTLNKSMVEKVLDKLTQPKKKKRVRHTFTLNDKGKIKEAISQEL